MQQRHRPVALLRHRPHCSGEPHRHSARPAVDNDRPHEALEPVVAAVRNVEHQLVVAERAPASLDAPLRLHSVEAPTRTHTRSSTASHLNRPTPESTWPAHPACRRGRRPRSPMAAPRAVRSRGPRSLECSRRRRQMCRSGASSSRHRRDSSIVIDPAAPCAVGTQEASRYVTVTRLGRQGLASASSSTAGRCV